MKGKFSSGKNYLSPGSYLHRFLRRKSKSVNFYWALSIELIYVSIIK